MGIEPIIPEHKKILDKIRELYVESGGEPLNDPEDLGLNKYEKSHEGIEIEFDYGVPSHMLTPDGYYMILGSCVCGNSEKFWELFSQEFETTIVVPKRDDSNIRGSAKYQSCYSGPVVRIR
jgi:hypothetical protein